MVFKTKAAEDGLYRTGDDNPSTKLTDKEAEWCAKQSSIATCEMKGVRAD